MINTNTTGDVRAEFKIICEEKKKIWDNIVKSHSEPSARLFERLYEFEFAKHAQTCPICYEVWNR